MFEDEEQAEVAKHVNVWDFFALLAHLMAEIFHSVSEAFAVGRGMLENKASVMEDKKLFHEYATRTIESLQEGE